MQTTSKNGITLLALITLTVLAGLPFQTDAEVAGLTGLVPGAKDYALIYKLLNVSLFERQSGSMAGSE